MTAACTFQTFGKLCSTQMLVSWTHFFCMPSLQTHQPLTCDRQMQVHEKSILLALLPVTLLAFDQPFVAAWLPFWATLSMYPLLKKDGLSIAYLGCLFLWLAVAAPPASLTAGAQPADQVAQSESSHMKASRKLGPRGPSKIHLDRFSGQQWLHYASVLSLVPAACIHASQCVVQPPARFMHLYDAAFVSLSFLHVAATALYLNATQWSLSRTSLSREHNKTN